MENYGFCGLLFMVVAMLATFWIFFVEAPAEERRLLEQLEREEAERKRVEAERQRRENEEMERKYGHIFKWVFHRLDSDARKSGFAPDASLSADQKQAGLAKCPACGSDRIVEDSTKNLLRTRTSFATVTYSCMSCGATTRLDYH